VGGSSKFLGVLTLILGVIGFLAFIGFFFWWGFIPGFTNWLIPIPLVALAATYALIADDDFSHDHRIVVGIIAASSGLSGLIVVPYILNTLSIEASNPANAATELGMLVWMLFLPLMLFVVSLVPLFLVDAIVLFGRLWKKPAKPEKLCSACGSNNFGWRMYCDICGRPLG